MRADIDEVNLRVYDTINNGVYNAGFARLQGAYERAFKRLFESFAWLEELLGKQRYLLGEQVTEADWRLFPTLVRFDEVYHLHFRCNYRRIVEYPKLWAYTRELYQWPGGRGQWRCSRSSAITTRPMTSSTPSTSSRSGLRRIGPSRTGAGNLRFATLAGVVATGALGGVHHRGATSRLAARLGILRSSTLREDAP